MVRLLPLAGLIIPLGCLALGEAPKPELLIPAGTKVTVVLVHPIWAATVRLGDAVYGQAAFPVVVNNEMAIPPGAYLRGIIEIMSLPRVLSEHAEFRFQFGEIVFANNYVVPLSDAAFANVNVEVSRRNDVLLDAGAQFEMVLERPLGLDAVRLAAVRRSPPPGIRQWRSSSRCQPIPPTPGAPGTVIPGTPGTPGTPPVVIPGGPNSPDIVIPGTPATPGTPDTIVGGTPGTPGIPCPGPPLVIPKPVVHKAAFRLKEPVRIAGRQGAPGTYEAEWEGLGPIASVRISRKGREIAVLKAQVRALGKAAQRDDSTARTNADGSLALESVQFAGRNFGLRFDQ